MATTATATESVGTGTGTWCAQRDLQTRIDPPGSKPLDLPTPEDAADTDDNCDTHIDNDDNCDTGNDNNKAMSRAVEDVLAYVDHFTFFSGKDLFSGKIVPFMDTPKTSNTDTVTGNDIDIDTRSSSDSPGNSPGSDRDHPPSPQQELGKDNDNDKHPINTTTTITTTSALLDRTNTLFPDMTPFHSRPQRSPSTPRGHPRRLQVQLPVQLRPLQQAEGTGEAFEPKVYVHVQLQAQGEPSTATATSKATTCVTPPQLQPERIRITNRLFPKELLMPMPSSESVHVEAETETRSKKSTRDRGKDTVSDETEEADNTNMNTSTSVNLNLNPQTNNNFDTTYEQQAWEEREKARTWARDLRNAVYKWAQQQKECLACERQEAQQSQNLQQQVIVPRYQKALVAAEDNVRNLERELTSSRQHFQSAERQLYEVIHYQQVRLQQLEATNSHLQTQQQQQQQQPTQGPTIPSACLPCQLEASSSSSSSSVMPTVAMPTDTDTSDTVPTDTETTDTGIPTPRQVPVSPETAPAPAPVPKASATFKAAAIDSTTPTPRPRMRRCSENGTQFVTYGNGSTKEIHIDGTTVIRFPNGDVKTHRADTGTVAYHYAASNVTQIVVQAQENTSMSTILEFPNGQVEQHWIDGRKIVSFPDGTTQRVAPDGSAETVLADQSSVYVEHSSGKKEWVHLATTN